MVWRQGFERCQLLDHLWCDPDRCGKVRAAVHHPVTGSGKIAAVAILRQPREQQRQSISVISNGTVHPRGGQRDAVAVGGRETRRNTNAGDLPAKHQPRIGIA